MSEAHRAVMGLVRLSVRGRPDADLEASLAKTDPLALAEIAQFHRVHTILGRTLRLHPALGAALPDDLRVFLSEIDAANARRNAAIREQTLAIGRAAETHGVRLVALKGAAELLCAGEGGALDRYLSDIDVLVRAEEMDRARVMLGELGGIRQDRTVSEGHHHDPAYLSPDWIVPIELHSALGDASVERLLPVAEVVNAATPTEHPGLHVPALHHRLSHLVAHDQINGHGHATI